MPSLGTIALVIVLAAIARWFYLAWQVRIPATPARFMAVWGLGTALALAALASGESGAAAWAAGLGALVLYLGATGAQRLGAGAIKVGATVPAFSAVDEHGDTFDSATLAGQRFLLKFFRGHW